MPRVVTTLIFFTILGGCAIPNGSYNAALTQQAEKDLQWVRQNKATCGIFWPVSAIEDTATAHAGSYYVRQWGHQPKGARYGLFTKPHWKQCYREGALSIASKNCATYYGEPCELVFYRPFGMDEAKHNTWLPSLLSSAKERQVAASLAEAKKQAQTKLLQETSSRAKTCESFGFTADSKEHSMCMFELYKLEEAAKQNRLNRSALANASAQQQKIMEQQLQEQKFESGMRLLQQSADMLNAPNPRITCQYNQIAQQVVCK